MKLPNVFVEDPEYRFSKVFLDDDVYEQAMKSFVFACTDAVPVDYTNRVIYLTRRNVLPMKGWWWIGGRRFAGETAVDSVSRCFKRETKLELGSERFRFVMPTEFMWATRQQEPQDVGCHIISYVFAIQLSDAQLNDVSENLVSSEYESGVGLQPFSRERLVREGVTQPILDFYDAIFS